MKKYILKKSMAVLMTLAIVISLLPAMTQTASATAIGLSSAFDINTTAPLYSSTYDGVTLTVYDSDNTQPVAAYNDIRGALAISDGYDSYADYATFELQSGGAFKVNSLDIMPDTTTSDIKVYALNSSGGVIIGSEVIEPGIAAQDKKTIDLSTNSYYSSVNKLKIVVADAFWVYKLDIIPASANAAPTVSNLNGDSVTFTEDGSAVLLDKDSNATVTDSDNPVSLNGGNVIASISANRVVGEDVLSIKNIGTSAGQIGVSGTTVSYGGTAIGTYTGGTGSNDLVVTLNSSATLEATTALIKALTYANTNSTDPNTTTRTVRVTVNDGSGGTSSNADVSVGITAVNDAPVVTTTGG